MNDMKLQELSQFRGKIAIVYDTETTGLPRDDLSLDSQPHVAQMAWQLIKIPDDPSGKFAIIAEFQSILKLRYGGTMSAGAESVHGISQKICGDLGFEPLAVFEMFYQAVSFADIIVAHNEKFDRQLVKLMEDRMSKDMSPFSDEGEIKFRKLPVACTMDLARGIVKLPPTARMRAVGRMGYKTPKLTEAYEALVGGTFDGAHDAMVDVRATVKVFAALMARGAADESDYQEAQLDG